MVYSSRNWIAPQPAPIAKAAVVVRVDYSLWQNRQLRTIWFAASGIVPNAIAMRANGGQMPVAANAPVAAGREGFLRFMQNASDAVHNLIGAVARMRLLVDAIPLAQEADQPERCLPVQRVAVFSPQPPIGLPATGGPEANQ